MTGEIFEVIAPSAFRLVAGFVLAASVGIALGLVMGMFRQIYNLLEPLTELFRPIPGAAIIPAAILLLGIGDSMKIGVIAFSAVFPVLINTYGGVRAVDPIQIDTARTLGLSRSQIARHVILPAAAPYIFAGMRISLAVALILVIVTEMLTGGGGLGYFILSSQRVFKVPDTYAGIVVIGLFGYLLNRAFLWVQDSLLGWHSGMMRQLQ
jgi:ABC-type nitrate/sulfonate/bicarbonate transport system permease component